MLIQKRIDEKNKNPFIPQIKFKKITKESEYNIFLSCNSSFKTSLEFLKNNDTYLLYKNNEPIGGYVYGMNKPMKGIEVIKDQKVVKKVYDKFENKKVAEISTLWLKKEYRKTYLSKILWFSIAYKTFFGKADYYLFATNNEKLRKAMNYPSCTFEFMIGEIKKQSKNSNSVSYYFLAEKNKTLLGMLQGVFYLTFRPKFNLQKKHNLKEFEISS